MKKILFALIAGLFAVPLFAAYQYDYGTISGASSDKRPDSKYTAYADRGGSAGLQNTLYFNHESYLYLDIAKGAGANFGAYYLDGATRGADLNLQLTADGRYSAFDADGNAVQFNPGDAIGFWYEDANGKIVYNTPRLEGEHRQTYNATWIKDQDTYMIGFGEYGQYINSRNPDQIYGESAFVMDVQVGGTAPTGQPLPGVLATLLIGGAVATGRRLYRRRAC